MQITFLHSSLLKSTVTFFIVGLLLASCVSDKNKEVFEAVSTPDRPLFTLGQWSYHEALRTGDMTTVDFIRKAGELGFDGVEYVDQFFADKVNDEAFLQSLRLTAEEVGVQNMTLLVDTAGELCASDSMRRDTAIQAARAWIRAASIMGCRYVRFNAYGDGDPPSLKQQCIRAFSGLGDYGEELGVGVLIENHGGLSNNGQWLSVLIGALIPNGVHALADFDNWCLERENGGLWGGPCVLAYDRTTGFRQLLPYARGVSVKAFAFDETGEETTIPYDKMFGLMREARYSGYLGIEYEGGGDVTEGVLKTRELAAKKWREAWSEE